jgi:hypothetical protein
MTNFFKKSPPVDTTQILTVLARVVPCPVGLLCDIGAAEYGATFPRLWLPLIVR